MRGQAEPKPYAEIGTVLRLLVRKAESRKAAWPHFQTAMRLLEGFSAANAPCIAAATRTRVAWPASLLEDRLVWRVPRR